MSSKPKVTNSSGNVFEDLGVPNATEEKTKVRLAMAINHTLFARRLRQAVAAKATGATQPQISAIANYKLDGFSEARLIELLKHLGKNIDILITDAEDGHGRVRVHENTREPEFA
jgi:predicted XRE-type DNA-binding protein